MAGISLLVSGNYQEEPVLWKTENDV